MRFFDVSYKPPLFRAWVFLAVAALLCFVIQLGWLGTSQARDKGTEPVAAIAPPPTAMSTPNPNIWSRTGPVVGTVTSLAIAPSRPSILYAGVSSNSGGFGGTSNSGIYKSTDSGLSWSKSGLVGNTTYSLAVDPTNFDTVYAGTYRNGLYKSTDGGSTWNGPYINNSVDVYTLAISPNNSSVLYGSATNLGVIKSTDAGLTWNTIDNGIHFGYLRSIVVDPANTNTIYAVGGYGSCCVYKSTDEGANWAIASIGIPDSTNDVLTGVGP